MDIGLNPKKWQLRLGVGKKESELRKILEFFNEFVRVQDNLTQKGCLDATETTMYNLNNFGGLYFHATDNPRDGNLFSISTASGNRFLEIRYPNGGDARSCVLSGDYNLIQQILPIIGLATSLKPKEKARCIEEDPEMSGLLKRAEELGLYDLAEAVRNY